MSYFGKLHLRRDYFGGHQSRQLSICHTVSFGRCRGEKCDDSIEQAHQKENTMKKIFTGMLVLALLASLIGCSAETITSADASASNLIYENTISPNEKYIAQESDKVFYTIQVYQEENGVKVASSSNSAFSQAMSYQVETAEPITKENINVQWQTLMGNTEDSKGDQFAVADVTISVQGKVISERKVSFIGKALDMAADAIEQK